ncbi:MAG: hypothetical protein Unbinned3818contig1000_54 [Prokaryotic dsDNA virus sp.]|nr:hypothetical protein [Phycisphaerae bacterium]QDP45983.1 MAG: hypothetical protein Unbinned3818contig1000_54 [Prokaryotic dsDNA virus sp.]|tara:strand:+ start:27587 stop:28966 length:1380 start_codon:yes stop_codon:yes gene_type:complete
MAKTIVEELVGILGLDIDEKSFKQGAKSLENVKQQYERVASAATKFAVAGAALAGFTVITNKLTAEQENLAASVGISGEALEAYGALAKQAGLNTDNVVDLVEELNNKLGESKGIEEVTAVKEATAILGLEFEKLRKLKPEEQFFKILDAAKQLEDQQKAVSAADILMGGEANKFIGLLRQQDGSLQDLLDSHFKLNLLTKENRQATIEFNRSFGQFSVILGSATKQLGAFLGRGLKPVIDFVVEWVAENKELSQSIIKVFSIVLPAALALAGVAVAAMTVKLVAMGIALLGVTWPVVLFIALWTAAATAIALVVNDIVTFVKYGFEADTVIGSLINKVRDLWAAFSESNIGMFLTDKINAAIDSIKDILGWLFKLGFSVGQKIRGATNSASDAISSVGNGIAGAVSSVSSAVSSVTNHNSFAINAAGMDSAQLNQAIDSRVGQNNAIAANANSTGIER